MSIEENKALVRRLYQLYYSEKKNWDAAYELYASDLVIHSGGPDTHLEELKQ